MNGVFHFGSKNTITAILDLTSGTIISRNVSETGHGMFCPGLSLGSDGRVFVSGGTSAEKLSIYDEALGEWMEASEMRLGRGYHSHVTTTNGRIFTLGGSWSGRIGDKDGEVFDPAVNEWTALPGCTSLGMLTNDHHGAIASDNHAWLVSWSNESVFQAGPSSAMNWYNLDGPGSTAPAGSRGDDDDSMNGNAVLYDALHGKILTVGGARNYNTAPGSRAAHIITLGEPFARPTVERINDMHSARVYANSVVLPNGEVFVSGGATWAAQWTDVNASWVPEMWNPFTHKFTEIAVMPVPRTYHSFSLLLPDATVLVGGGGLCWEGCADYSVNHENVQVFRPPYLFDEHGRMVTRRPKVMGISKEAVSPGDSLVVRSDVEFVDLVLIRYSSATHSTNTDQRRVKLLHHPVPHQDGADASVLETWNHATMLPRDPGILVPGYWMLFAVDESGVPSVATTILVKKPGD
jgi:galactose oxidase